MLLQKVSHPCHHCKGKQKGATQTRENHQKPRTQQKSNIINNLRCNALKRFKDERLQNDTKPYCLTTTKNMNFKT